MDTPKPTEPADIDEPDDRRDDDRRKRFLGSPSEKQRQEERGHENERDYQPGKPADAAPAPTALRERLASTGNPCSKPAPTLDAPSATSSWLGSIS